MPIRPSNATADLLAATVRAQHARRTLAGFSRSTPVLNDLWRQIDDALSDVPGLTTQITRLRIELAAVSLNRANLAAAGRAAIAAYRDGEPDSLTYLSDELAAQGFASDRRGG